MRQIKQKVYDVMEEIGDKDSRFFEIIIQTLIMLNIVSLILETVDWLYLPHKYFFHVIDLIFVLVFTIEFALRVWASTATPAYRHPLWGRLRYAFTTIALIDLLAILPFYLPLLGLEELRYLRSLRLFRLFKLFRYSKTLSLFQKVVWDKRQELLTTLVFLLFMLLFASSLMYHAEHMAQPEAFSSIPAAMWWAIATLTTVGYGDVFPVTTWGRVLASIIAVLGIGMFALPTGIMGAAFVEEVESRKEEQSPAPYCPHCGEKLN